jgi:hypothetical protein
MNLKIKFMPYEKFSKEGLGEFIESIKEDTIILIDAKLTAEQEAEIIKETMMKVTQKFPGIEMSSIELFNHENMNNFGRIKNAFVEAIIGKKRGMTLIGPAKIVHKIKKAPEELLLYV